jgi:hypothetical protein
MSKEQVDLYQNYNDAVNREFVYRVYLSQYDGDDVYDRTDRVISFNATHEISDDLGLTSTISQATVVVSNIDGYFTPDPDINWWDVGISIWWGYLNRNDTYLGEFANMGVLPLAPNNNDYVHVLSDNEGKDNWFRWESANSVWRNICDTFFRGYIKEHSLNETGSECTLTCWDRSMKFLRTVLTTKGNVITGTDNNPTAINDAMLYVWKGIAGRYSRTYGDGTTEFTITNPVGNTFRYTWTGVGGNPNFVASGLTTNHYVSIYSEDITNSEKNVVKKKITG